MSRSPKIASSKYFDALGRSTIDEMDKMDESSLKKVIVQATASMAQAKDELNGNPKYQELKGLMSAATSGLKAVNKRQNARIGYALHRLAELGKEPASESVEMSEQGAKV